LFQKLAGAPNTLSNFIAVSCVIGALLKYEAIAPLLRPDIEVAERRRLRVEILANAQISDRTLRRYLQSYREKGFEGLIRRERSDKGKCSIPEEILKEAGAIREELPQRSTSRIIQILENENIVEKGKLSLSSMDRHLKRLGLSSRELRKKEGVKGVASRRFCKTGRNMLWQTDVKYGPYIPDTQKPGKNIRTYLVAFIDDATRLVCHAEFYTDSKLPVLEDCFRKALIKYGIPDSVYVDNGKIFISTWFRMACARLGVRHIHTKPYSPESKGKIERFNRTIEEFMGEIGLEKPKTLEELNRHLRTWLEEGYNNREHSSLNKVSPSVAFTNDKRHIRFVTPEECRDAFLWEETRKVDKTGCISLKSQYYEAGMEFINKKVDARYDPFDLSSVEIWHNGEKKKTVTPLVIGEYCGKKEEKATTSTKSSHSRLLKTLDSENKKKRKKQLGAIPFREMKGGVTNA
jgi:putative transposase